MTQLCGIQDRHLTLLEGVNPHLQDAKSLVLLYTLLDSSFSLPMEINSIVG